MVFWEYEKGQSEFIYFLKLTQKINGTINKNLLSLKFQVHQFKGKTYVDLREFYVDKSTEETKPGKKGISLNVEEYQMLKEIIPEIDSNLG